MIFLRKINADNINNVRLQINKNLFGLNNSYNEIDIFDLLSY